MQTVFYTFTILQLLGFFLKFGVSSKIDLLFGRTFFHHTAPLNVVQSEGYYEGGEKNSSTTTTFYSTVRYVHPRLCSGAAW